MLGHVDALKEYSFYLSSKIAHRKVGKVDVDCLFSASTHQTRLARGGDKHFTGLVDLIQKVEKALINQLRKSVPYELSNNLVLPSTGHFEVSSIGKYEPVIRAT